jgi:nitroreductase
MTQVNAARTCWNTLTRSERSRKDLPEEVASMATPQLSPALADDHVKLPSPSRTAGKPLMEVLGARKSHRVFSAQKLDPAIVSDLLWAAFGINRRDGHRTAPSAHNWQEVDIYLALDCGVFRFDPTRSQLNRILHEDIRSLTGQQDFVGSAPLNLVYVADLARMPDAKDRDEQRFYSALDTGFIAQNVYLFCASEGLSTVVRGLIDRQALAARMGLRPEQRVIAAQTVGYPAA